jgi:thiamine kinase-like enzyme
MSRPELERLEAALASMLGSPLRLEQLAVGTTGTTWLVETAGGRFAAKVFASDSLALLGPEAQHALLEVLAGTGIVPRPLGFDAEARMLVTEYLDEAAAVAPDELRSAERIGDVVAALRVLHAASADIPRFDPVADAWRYVRSVGGLEALTAGDREYLDELLGLAESLELGQATLCHNDLVASNLLCDRGIKLIDFDYAVLAAPELDLASVAFMNAFTAREASRLLDVYFDGASPLSPAEFARVQRLVRLVAHFWALASAPGGAAIVGQYRIRHD